jgi:hypothetical protein
MCLGGILHLKPTAGCQISTLIFGFRWGDPMNIPLKIAEGRQSYFPLRAWIKGIARAFHWLKCLGGFLHLKFTAGCQISTLIFEFCFVEGGGVSIKSHEKYIKDGNVLDHLGFKSKVLPGPLTDWSALVGFCTSSPQYGVKYQLYYYFIFLCRGVSINIPWKIYQGRQSS